ncbi:MAG: hypothetical protein R3F07_06595 [Opitutaceae bacterium]
MKILNKNSLIETVDRFNEAVFWDRDWVSEAGAIQEWTGDRLSDGRGYAGGLAMTEADWSRTFRLFTGEVLTTRAGRAHVIAEEGTRMLALIENVTGVSSQAREVSEKNLASRIFESEGSKADADGDFCCGTCSVALWRALAAGVYRGHASALERGLKTLSRHRLPGGGWKRYPFYYTVSCLVESASLPAVRELRFHRETIQRRIGLLKKKSDRFANRRRELLTRALDLAD